MTLSSLNKLRQRDGVTLVELLVVILIVTILAVTMLPMFKKYVVQAQYAAEPIPLVGHIRTQIGLYQYEHNSLPGGTKGCVFGFQKSSGGEAYERTYAEIDDSGTVGSFKTAMPSGATPYLTDMDVSANELNGKRISPDQVFYALIKNDAAYEYAIGVFGKKGGLGEGTGYAVLEAYFPNCVVAKATNASGADASEKGFKLVATWKNYTGEGCGDEPGQIKFGVARGGASQEGVCEIFSDEFLSGTDFGASGVQGAVEALRGAGCGTWEISALPGGN